ncbi:dimethylamine monooxygenase subunit DmmA family protein [Nocardioides sambongensis]|uniref:dimethylamine monooxygenase subunit DmmA family protein n=1 Tax=Nocardioides sambongensis TaxID=2589074 RepID=UPI0015E849F1|nr:dimethylamine monooxygenase subunit DmmA family protein [Nocardioides sambongensis]
MSGSAPHGRVAEWPDPAAGSFLIVSVGADPVTAARTAGRTADAEAIGSTRLVVLDDVDHPADAAALADALAAARTGVRILLLGGRYDVLQAAARAREAGAIPAEITLETTHAVDLPVYCAHCRGTHRVAADPGERVLCPGCARLLEIHDHLAGTLGAFLASDTGEAPVRAGDRGGPGLGGAELDGAGHGDRAFVG